MSGRRYVPAADPSTFIEKPWNSWTFERTNITTSAFEPTLITIADVLTQISGKLGVSADRLIVKVQRVAVWCTAAGLLQPDVACSFYELSEKTVVPQMVRSQQRDLGTLNRPARCGYIYPMVDQKEIIYKLEEQLIISNSVATSIDSRVTTRVSILWNVQDSA